MDVDSFGKSSADVPINYISNLNDNLFTTTRYLMSNLYYMPKKDTSIKFFFYDLFSD